MCVITICKIFTCWHLEPIFAVKQCEHAASVLKRYCNRSCCSPLLVGTFIETECEICKLDDVESLGLRSPSIHRPATSSTQQQQQQQRQRQQQPPSPNPPTPYETPYIDLFRAIPPMRNCFVNQPFDIGTLISSEWVRPIKNAFHLTEILLVEALGAWFPMEEPAAQRARARFEAWLHSHPLEMEVLEVRECVGDGIGVCVCQGNRRGRREAAGSARLPTTTPPPIPPAARPPPPPPPPPPAAAQLPPQPERHAPPRRRTAPYPPPPLPRHLREGGQVVPAPTRMTRASGEFSPGIFQQMVRVAVGVHEAPPMPGSGMMVQGWVVTACWDDLEDEDEEEEEELEEGEVRDEGVGEVMMVDAVNAQGVPPLPPRGLIEGFPRSRFGGEGPPDGMWEFR